MHIDVRAGKGTTHHTIHSSLEKSAVHMQSIYHRADYLYMYTIYVLQSVMFIHAQLCKKHYARTHKGWDNSKRGNDREILMTLVKEFEFGSVVRGKLGTN